MRAHVVGMKLVEGDYFRLLIEVTMLTKFSPCAVQQIEQESSSSPALPLHETGPLQGGVAGEVGLFECRAEDLKFENAIRSPFHLERKRCFAISLWHMLLYFTHPDIQIQPLSPAPRNHKPI